MSSLTWVVKASKFCNLRCSYCYEWDNLGDRTRMSPTVWEAVCRAASHVHTLARERELPLVQHFAMHGGEPMLVPDDVYREMHRVASVTLPATSAIHWGMQTNLYTLPRSKIELLKELRIGLGVSFDFYAGHRRTAGGKETEARVVDNMRRLIEAEIPFGVISVLAAHNIAFIDDLLRLADQLARPLRLLPLFDGPDSRPTGFEVGEAALEDAVFSACRMRLSGQIELPLIPVDSILATATRHLIGLAARKHVDIGAFNGVLVVDTTGEVYADSRDFAADTRIGHISHLATDAGVLADALAVAGHVEISSAVKTCSGCEFAESCSGYPAVAADKSSLNGRCRVIYGVIARVVEDMRAAGDGALADAAFGEAAATGFADADVRSPSFALAV